MPRGSYQDREREDRQWRKTAGRVQRLERQKQSRSGIKATIASGQIDHILVIPTRALERTVYNTYIDEKDFGRTKYVVKGYTGSSRDYWDVLVAMASGDATIGELRQRFGDVQATSSIVAAMEDNMINLDTIASDVSF